VYTAARRRIIFIYIYIRFRFMVSFDNHDVDNNIITIVINVGTRARAGRNADSVAFHFNSATNSTQVPPIDLQQ